MRFRASRFYDLLGECLANDERTLSEWLMDELDLGRSAVSRRLTGEVAPTIDEVITIFQKVPAHAQLSLELLEQLNLIPVEYTPIVSEEAFFQHLQRIESLLKAAPADAVMMYAARDVPFFLFLNQTFLLNYKYSLWSGRLSKEGIVELPPEVHLVARRIYDLYQGLNTRELWFEDALFEQGLQLSYERKFGSLTIDQEIQLREELTDVLTQHSHAIVNQMKEKGGKLSVRCVPYFTMNNGGAIEMGSRTYVWSSLWNAQTITSTSKQVFGQFKEQWLSHRSRGTPITSGPPSERLKWKKMIQDFSE